MIQTKQYSISKKEYTKIIIQKRFEKTWWLYVLMIIVGTFHLQKFGEDNFSSFIAIFAFSYPFLTIAYLYFWTNSKGHKPIFSETNLSFDDDYLYFKRNDSETKLNPSSIQKVISNTDNWMLYVSKGQFIYVPKDIFYSNEDYLKFIKIIKAKQ